MIKRKMYGVNLKVLGKYLFMGFMFTYFGVSLVPATIFVAVGDKVGDHLTEKVFKVK